MDDTRRKKWFLRKKNKKMKDGKYPFGDKARGDDEQDVTPWSNKQRSEKGYQSGATGPSIANEPSTPSPNTIVDPSSTLGRPGMDYPTQSHHGI